MGKLTLTIILILTAPLFAEVTGFYVTGQTRETLHLEFGKKKEVFYTLKDKTEQIYEILISFELQKESDHDVIVFDVIRDDIPPADDYRYIYIFSQTESWRTLREAIDQLPNITLTAHRDAPEHIIRFFSTPEREKDIVELIEPFYAYYASFQQQPGRNGDTGFIKFRIADDFIEGSFSLDLHFYYGAMNTLHGRFDPVRLTLVLPEEEQELVAETDCPALERKHNAEIQKIMADMSFEHVHKSFLGAADSERTAEINSALSVIDGFLDAISALTAYREEIAADKELYDCPQVKEELLSRIMDFTGHKSRVAGFRSGLMNSLDRLNHCNKLLSEERTGYTTLRRQFNNAGFQQQISEINSEIAKMNLSEINEKDAIEVNRMLSGAEKQVNDLIDELDVILVVCGRLKERLADLYDPECSKDINLLADRINTLERQAESQLNALFETNTIINDGLNQTNPQRLETIETLRNKYRPLLAKIENQLISLFKEIEGVKAQVQQVLDHEEGFYARNQSSLLNEVSAIAEQKDAIIAEFESIQQDLSREASAPLGSHRTANIANEAIRSVSEKKHNLEQSIRTLENEITALSLTPASYMKTVLIILIFAVFALGTWAVFQALQKNNHALWSGLSAIFGNNPKVKNKRPSPTQEALQQEISKRSRHRSAKVGGVTIRPKYADSSSSHLIHKGRGIEHIRKDGGKNYYLVNLGSIWEDTMVQNVYIHRDCIKKVYRFFYESCVADNKVLETGGYMVGFWEYNLDEPGRFDVSMEDFIEPGDDAIYGEYQLNFGAKIGVRLDKVIRNYKEKTGRNMILTAWFHSHPGMKIFLSNHDLDVQERITNDVHKQKLLAFVMDPNTQEKGKVVFSTGIFSYKTNGLMNNNSGNMKHVKWKELYDWALSPVVPDFESFFCVDMHTICRKSLINKIYFNDQCIIRFSLFLDEHIHRPDILGYFTGEIHNDMQTSSRVAVLKDFITDLDKISEKQNVIACFKSGNVRNISSTTNFYPEYKDVDVLMFCDDKQKGLYILTRKSNKVFNSIADVKNTLSVGKLESWPTRRR